jgi:hypothetical protein
MSFKEVITLNGLTYNAARQPLDPNTTGIAYVPKTISAIQDQAGAPQLDPINVITMHHGSGASRDVGLPMAAWGENIWVCDPGLILPGPLVTRVSLPVAGTAAVPGQGFAEYGGDIFFVAGRYVYRIPAGNGTIAQDFDLGLNSNGNCFQLGFGQLLLSAGPTGIDLSAKTGPGAGNWTQALTGPSAIQPGTLSHVFWTTGGVTSERIIGQFGATTIRYTNGGDPRNSNSWTPGLTANAIDVGPYTINRFIATLDHLYIATTGGLRDLDSSGNAPMLTPEIELQQMATNGQAVLAAGGYIYVNGGYSLYRVPVTSTLNFAQVQLCTPGNPTMLPNETPVHGYVTAMTRNGQWVIACQYDDTNNISWISWGREAFAGFLTSPIEPAREAGPMVWNMCPIVLRGQKVTSLWVSGLVTANPRLWIAGIDNAANVIIQWAPLATQTPYQDLRNGRPYQFNPGTTTTVSLTHPAYDAGDDSMPKDLEEVVIEAENLTAGNQVILKVATDAAPSVFAQVGNFAQGPRQTLQPSLTVVGNRIIPQLLLQGGVSAPVVVRKQSFRVNPRPEMAQVRTYFLRLGRFERHAFNDPDETDPLVRMSQLEALQVGSRATLIDEAQQTMVVLLKHIGQVVEAEDSVYGGRVLAATIMLRVVSATQEPLLSLTPGRYDSTATYDTVWTYS